MKSLVKWFDSLPVKGWVAVVAAIIGGALSVWAFIVNPNTTPNCQTNPLRLVYDPSRLQVVARCQTITGTVKLVTREHDDDLHILFAVDPKWLDAANYKDQQGDLVVEFMPTDHYPTPVAGDRLQLLCTLVNDVGHAGWRECHPAFRDTVLSGGSQPREKVPLDRTAGNE